MSSQALPSKEGHAEDIPNGSIPDLKTLRAQIPAHCFQPSLSISIQYVIRDLFLLVVLFSAALRLTQIPESSFLKTLGWVIYGFSQGLVLTGLWILAHECGHNAFSIHKTVNSVIGFFLHSICLVPFFSWKFSHARHHRFANNMEKDTVFVPPSKDEYRNSLWTGDFLGHAADAPLVSILLLVAHQLVGWPLYIIFNAGAGPKSLASFDRSKSVRQSHLDPGAHLFTPREHPFVLLSNFGIIAVLSALWYLSKFVGTYNVFLLYGVPYLWMNNWLVAITYLHHTHPDVPHYTDSSWTFQNGALSTIDRDFGFIGRHMFHGIIEYHVIHHMFPRIPFYYAEEATKAIAPSLGNAYRQEQTSFIADLWSTFTACSFVEESGDQEGLMFWSQAGGGQDRSATSKIKTSPSI